MDGEISMVQTELGNILAETMPQNYTNEAYVRNNVALDDVSSHVLLYGLNLEWEETLLRGLGLSIVMVQADCTHHVARCVFAPSSEFDTRILTPDNIEKV
jgi:hypothetical protein